MKILSMLCQNYLEEKAINDKNLRNLLAEVKSYKKKYNIESKNIEQKKIRIKIKKEQNTLQQEVIKDRKNTNIMDVSRELLDEIKTVHEDILDDKKISKGAINSQAGSSISENNNEIKRRKRLQITKSQN